MLEAPGRIRPFPLCLRASLPPRCQPGRWLFSHFPYICTREPTCIPPSRFRPPFFSFGGNKLNLNFFFFFLSAIGCVCHCPVVFPAWSPPRPVTPAYTHTYTYIRIYKYIYDQRAPGGACVYTCVYICMYIYSIRVGGGGVCVRAAPCFGKLGEMGFWAKTLQIWGGAKGRDLGGGGDTHLPPHNRGRGSGREWGKNERHLNIGFFPGLVCWGFFFGFGLFF